MLLLLFCPKNGELKGMRTTVVLCCHLSGEEINRLKEAGFWAQAGVGRAQRAGRRPLVSTCSFRSVRKQCAWHEACLFVMRPANSERLRCPPAATMRGRVGHRGRSRRNVFRAVCAGWRVQGPLQAVLTAETAL